MRLRANFRGIAERLSYDQKRTLLHSLINNSNRYYLEEHLRRLNIPGRTRIYKAFGWSWGNQDTRDRHEIQGRHVDNILQNSDVVYWIEQYCSEYTLGSFLDIATRTKLDLNGFNIRIEQRNE